MKKIVLYIGIVILLFGCKKEIGPQFVNPDSSGSGSILILNEGNFGFGNTSVSIYNPISKSVSNNQYRNKNGVGIGDVLQSVNRYQNKYYFVVNNSGKVVVTDTNLNLLNEIIGFNSPRYIEFVGDKAFVTDLKQKAVYVVDLVSNIIVDQINTQGWTETILNYNNKLLVLDRGDYLSNNTPNYIYIINPTTHIKEDSIQTAINPNSMVVDRDNRLWVLSSGKASIENSKLTQYNIESNTIIKSFTFSNTLNNPSRLVIDKQKNRLFYINNSVYSIRITTSSLPSIPFYQKNGENLYGLYLNKSSNDIYVTDTKNYNQTGEVIRMNSSSSIIDKFPAGIIPQGIY